MLLLSLLLLLLNYALLLRPAVQPRWVSADASSKGN